RDQIDVGGCGRRDSRQLLNDLQFLTQVVVGEFGVFDPNRADGGQIGGGASGSDVQVERSAFNGGSRGQHDAEDGQERDQLRQGHGGTFYRGVDGGGFSREVVAAADGGRCGAQFQSGCGDIAALGLQIVRERDVRGDGAGGLCAG